MPNFLNRTDIPGFGTTRVNANVSCVAEHWFTNYHCTAYAPCLCARSKELEQQCTSTAALQGVCVQAVVTEFLISYVDLLFSDKLHSLNSGAQGGTCQTEEGETVLYFMAVHVEHLNVIPLLGSPKPMQQKCCIVCVVKAQGPVDK